MQFDWTTFVLELLNFLVLVWLLKHFFYRPVLDALDARRQAVLDQAAQAEEAGRKAEALKAEYEMRLQSWQREREQARQALQQEMAQERARQLDALKRALAEERAKSDARTQALAAQRETQLTRQASVQAYADVTAALKRLADPALTARIAAIAAEDLAALPEEQRDGLRQAAASLAAGAAVEVVAAHKLDAASLHALQAALEQAAGQQFHMVQAERPELIAGVRIALGDRLLQANLAEELAFFRSEAMNAGSEPHA